MSMILGLFANERSANQALGALTDVGVEPEAVSVVLPVDVRHFDASGASAVATGAIPFPLFGVMAAGPIVAPLAGAQAGGSTGGLLGAFADAGIPVEEAILLEDGINQGRILVTIEVRDGREAVLRDVLHDAGAQIELAA